MKLDIQSGLEDLKRLEAKLDLYSSSVPYLNRSSQNKPISADSRWRITFSSKELIAAHYVECIISFFNHHLKYLAKGAFLLNVFLMSMQNKQPQWYVAPFNRGSCTAKCRILIFLYPGSYHTLQATQGQRLLLWFVGVPLYFISTQCATYMYACLPLQRKNDCCHI